MVIVTFTELLTKLKMQGMIDHIKSFLLILVIIVSGSSQLLGQEEETPNISGIVNSLGGDSIEGALAEEMIDVAYGKRTKAGLTHAISVISASGLEKTPVPNLSNAITGRATGLTVIKSSGDEPGYDNSSIYVRGIGTFNSYRAPLIMVDNVVRDFTQLDPMEIESFSVLKDAAATVQYGIRGANGAINVRTKRGFIGKSEIIFVAQTGIQAPFRLPEYLGSEDYLTLYNKALANDGLMIPTDSKYDPEMYNGSQDKFTYPDVDWYNEFLKQMAPQQQYKLSLRGGSSVARYFLFMGATMQDGIYKYGDVNTQYNTNPKYSRFNLRSNIDVDVTESLLISIDIATRVENRHYPNSSAGSIFSTLSQLPPNAMPVINRDSSIAGTSIYRDNPLGMISKTGYRDNYQRTLLANVEATQKLDFLLEGLSLNGMIAMDGTNYYSTGRSQDYAVYQEFITSDTTEYIQYGDNSDISINTERFDGNFSYMFTTLGGFSYSTSKENSSFAADLKYMQSKYFLSGNNIAYANQGFFGRATYGMKDTYYFEFGFAYNGSEDFIEGSRFGFFPALSAAWIMSNEAFIGDDSKIDFMKMRGSIGKTGNGVLGVERFPYEDKYFTGGGYIFGEGYGTTDGAYEGRLANYDIGWEESYNINIGLDAEYKSGFDITIDMFSHYRNSIITTGENTIPSIIGQSLPYQNNGSVLNTGLETTIQYEKTRADWRYSLQLNVSFANNWIMNMEEADGLPDYQYQEGTSVTSMRGMEVVGFFMDETDIEASPLHTFENVQPGDVKYKDQNGDNIIDNQDEIVIGNSIPQANIGLIAYVGYKGFDVNLILSSSLGRTVMLTNNSIWVLQNNNKATAIAYGAWEAGKNEKDITYPRLTTVSNNNNYRNSSLWGKRADYLKLVNLEFGYSISTQAAQKMGINGIRIFINTYNLGSLDGISRYNLDPEIPDAGVTTYPVMRVFNTGINITF